MRLLFGGDHALLADLQRDGHELLKIDGVAKAAASALTKHPDAALITIGPQNVLIAAAIAATRVPLVLLFDRSSLQIEEAGIGLVTAILAAKQLVAADERTAQHLREKLDVKKIDVLSKELDVQPLELVDKEQARKALGLPLEQRFFSLTGSLDDQQLDKIAEAHRKLAGVGLLVAGDGAGGARFVQAMMIAARPSAPVLDIGSGSIDARVVAIRAADLAVSAGKEADPEPAALGRRQATLHDAGAIDALYPGLEAVHVAGNLLDAMQSALDVEIKRGPLPQQAIDRARAKLADRGGELITILKRAAGR